MQNRKQTAWKKSRKFGDVYGGRMKPKLTDNIFNRKHNLLPPADNQSKPIWILDNPSKSFYFPVTVDEIKDTLSFMPVEHTKFITHIWLSKSKKGNPSHGTLQGEFICGSGVYLIKLYALPINNKMVFGSIKPTGKQLNFYKPYCVDLQQDENGWYLQWREGDLKDYFLKKLLLHEIGHCVDYIHQRQWSKANRKQVEDFADNYAVFWGNNFCKTVEGS